MSGIEVSVRWSLALGGSIESPEGKISFKLYMYSYKQTYICIYVKMILLEVLLLCPIDFCMPHFYFH